MRTLIRGGWVVGNSGATHTLIRDGVVVYEDETIVHVGAEFDGQVDREIDASSKLVSPGFIDTHIHSGHRAAHRLITDAGRPEYFGQPFFETLPARRGRPHGGDAGDWVKRNEAKGLPAKAVLSAFMDGVRKRGGRLIAVGTTSLRLIESATGADGIIRPFEGDTSIFITPGYRFNGIDGLMTNFHLPKSTLFMLVSALMGLERMQAAYAHAIDNRYRFYSYGDSSLLLP